MDVISDSVAGNGYRLTLDSVNSGIAPPGPYPTVWTLRYRYVVVKVEDHAHSSSTSHSY